MDSIRLFTAIELPEDIRKALMPDNTKIHNCRTVPREQIHLTLRFIGPVGKDVFEKIKESLASVNKWPAFKLESAGCGFFPSVGRPNVFWTGLKQNAELLALRDSVDAALAEAGLEIKDDQKFVPHITIARIKDKIYHRDMEALKKLADFSYSFEVRSFTLFSSVLSNKGAVHTPESVISCKS